MIGSWIYSEGVDLSTQGCVCMSGESKTGEKGEKDITKSFVCQAKGFEFDPQATGCHLLILSRKVTSHILFWKADLVAELKGHPCWRQ